jgi:hypothetical protein
LLRARIAAAIAVGLVAAAGGGFALADAIGGSVPASAEKAAALSRLNAVATTDSNTLPAPAPVSEPHGIPAQILGNDVPVPIAPSLLRLQNAWLVSNGKTLVAVYAGAAGGDPARGRVVIVRQDLVAGTQTVKTIDAGRTGALTIAAAPLGPAVEGTAQTGTLRLRAPGGRTLTLDVGTSKVGRG